ncbi:minor capsid protein [Liquorilactobacillus hordei]|uniref:minor capsid protein n=1 Tax=Liquorilactobacillus hordei TaxID=468911 RepID=UPI0039EBBC03
MNQEKLNKIIQKFADSRYSKDVNNSQIRKIINSSMDDFLKFWYEFNENFDDYTKADDSRLANKKLKAKLDKLAKEYSIKTKGVANNDDLLQYATYVHSSALAKDLVKYTGGELNNEAVESIAVGVTAYDVNFKNKLKQIDELVNGTIDKTLWSDRLWSNMDALRSDLLKDMKHSLLTHHNPVTRTNELRKRYSVARYQAERILRTESSRVMAQSGIDSIQKAGYGKVVWVANSKACDECQSHIGEVYTLKQAQGVLPFHPNCRCAWSAYVD